MGTDKPEDGDAKFFKGKIPSLQRRQEELDADAPPPVYTPNGLEACTIDPSDFKLVKGASNINDKVGALRTMLAAGDRILG